jgi:hypothetical protein
MRGFPKHINTKEDVYTALDIDSDRTKVLLQAAIDGREGWHVTASLESEGDGSTDSTHRVVDKSDEESVADWYQEEWGPLPGNMLDRIGMSVSEAEGIIGE